MAEQSGFFDAHLVEGEYDRVYLAEHFAKYFASFIGNGIFGGKSNELMVLANNPSSMGVKVLSGQAWIDGYWYENDNECPLAIDIADGILHRIDSIVVRWNHSERIIRLAIKKGVAATNPVAPAVQRDNDYYELKLADISVRAGTTKITQTDIIDKRYHSDECGLVIGMVQQLDADEFGIQLDAYISDFIDQHDAWKNATVSDIEQWIANIKASYNSWYTAFKADSQAAINKFLQDNQTAVNTFISGKQTEINNIITAKTSEIDEVITDGQQRFNDVIEDLEQIAESNDVASLIVNVSNLKTDVSTLKTDNAAVKKDIENLKVKVEEPNGMGIEDETEVGCYYVEAADGIKEWINPPNRPGIEYRLTERWNGNPVYQRVLYVASLPNKTLMGVEVGTHYQKIISVSGFAIDDENLMHYPFPIIQNGLTPIAVIQGVESDGGEDSLVVIQTNENISHMTGYITVKYMK